MMKKMSIFLTFLFIALISINPLQSFSQAVLKVGHSYLGGRIFSVNGDHGLVVSFAEIDQKMTWYQAKDKCASYSITIDGKVYGDWRMPNMEELKLLFKRLYIKFYEFPCCLYWSSDESEPNNPYYKGTVEALNIPNGDRVATDGANPIGRALLIRAF
jgi:hypothetical protein